MNYQLVLLTAVFDIRPAIGNLNAAWAGKARFFAKKILPGSEAIFAKHGETKGGDFFVKTGGGEVKRSQTLPT